MSRLIEVVPIKFIAKAKNNDAGVKGGIIIDCKVMVHFPNGDPIQAGDLVAGKVYEFTIDLPPLLLSEANQWAFRRS